MSAAYCLVPASTPSRQARVPLKISGRIREIQRLIGRTRGLPSITRASRGAPDPAGPRRHGHQSATGLAATGAGGTLSGANRVICYKEAARRSLAS